MRQVRVATAEGRVPAATVHAGAGVLSLPCALSPDGDFLLVRKESMARLALVPGQAIHVLARDSDRRLHLGPLVGVMLDRKSVRLLEGGAERYPLMVREARAAGAVPLFFTLDDVDSEGGRVHALTERDGGWVRLALPLPDVVYNRATYPNLQERAHAAALRRDLGVRHGVSLLNGANSFSKWEVHGALQFFPGTADLAPETMPYGNPVAFMDMLDRHGQLYIKANHGSHGANVIRVSLAAGQCHVRGQVGGRPVDELFAVPDLLAFLNLTLGQGDWVVQQAIALPEVAGRVFDVRAILQKDGRGEWLTVLVLVRWARPGQVAANMSQGGEPFFPADFLERFGHEFPGLRDLAPAATAAAVRTAQALEARFGLLGEVGIDIAMDRDGRAWILEANTKPLHPQLPGLPVPLVRYPFHYAVYLAGRAWTGRNTGLALPVGPT